jgi:DHA1 family inner membrane transport protein
MFCMTFPLLALFLAAFAIGTTEFVVAGLLPNIAGELSVTIPTAGLLISGYATGVAICGPIMAAFTGGFERKTTLLGLMALFVTGNLLCALSPSYAYLMGARVITSLSHGPYYGTATVAAAALVPQNRRASAIAVVLAGITVANVLGVPLGTAIGSAFGWRMTFLSIAGLGVLGATGVAAWLPRGPKGGEVETRLVHQIRMLARQEVWLSLLIIILAQAGYFALLAYIAPVLMLSAVWHRERFHGRFHSSAPARS